MFFFPEIHIFQKVPFLRKPAMSVYQMLLLIAEMLHQLIGSLSQYLQGFYTSQVMQDFFHQQYSIHF